MDSRDNKESIERRFFPEIPSSERQRSRSDTERDRSSDHTRGILCRMAAWAVEVSGEETSNEWCEAVSDEEYGKLK